MNHRHNRTLVALALALVLGLQPIAASASRVLARITGVVTAPPTSDRIVVDGRPYPILPGTPAVAERNTVRVGQTVDLTLGPAGKSPSASQGVIGITVHPVTGGR